MMKRNMSSLAALVVIVGIVDRGPRVYSVNTKLWRKCLVLSWKLELFCVQIQSSFL